MGLETSARLALKHTPSVSSTGDSGRLRSCGLNGDDGARKNRKFPPAGQRLARFQERMNDKKAHGHRPFAVEDIGRHQGAVPSLMARGRTRENFYFLRRSQILTTSVFSVDVSWKRKLEEEVGWKPAGVAFHGLVDRIGGDAVNRRQVAAQTLFGRHKVRMRDWIVGTARGTHLSGFILLPPAS